MVMSESNCCLDCATAQWESVSLLRVTMPILSCGFFNHMIKINLNLCIEQHKIKRRDSIVDPTETNPTRANLVHYKSCRVNSDSKYSKALFPSLSQTTLAIIQGEESDNSTEWSPTKLHLCMQTWWNGRNMSCGVHSKIHLLRLTKHSHVMAIRASKMCTCLNNKALSSINYMQGVFCATWFSWLCSKEFPLKLDIWLQMQTLVYCFYS